ncbi:MULTISPECIES: hypothetical protein [Prochlorococcus]|uniref:Uncharacterized protein n=1 Tax=Prochlorococcus marinus (strain SARG / CCMP1375 / SS120) TaxID=167539 RepID=Q7VAD0_PROMA|nr:MULTISPECIES: hypothetical protein [Prochlorococcus]AAQ00578.1 Predicted protein [Prochlorococcus marinus subsp. marinus str. CCMP1375]
MKTFVINDQNVDDVIHRGAINTRKTSIRNASSCFYYLLYRSAYDYFNDTGRSIVDGLSRMVVDGKQLIVFA